MKNLIFIVLLVIVSNIKLFSQNYSCNCKSENSFIEDFEKKLNGIIFINSIIQYDIQLFNKWGNGDVILYDGSVIKNKYIRYNKYLDELLWLRKSDYKSAIVDKESISEFILYDEKNNFNKDKLPDKSDKKKILILY